MSEPDFRFKTWKNESSDFDKSVLVNNYASMTIVIMASRIPNIRHFCLFIFCYYNLAELIWVISFGKAEYVGVVSFFFFFFYFALALKLPAAVGTQHRPVKIFISPIDFLSPRVHCFLYKQLRGSFKMHSYVQPVEFLNSNWSFYYGCI